MLSVRARLATVFAAAFFIAGCGTEASVDTHGPALRQAQSGSDPDLNPALISARPYGLHVPTGYDGSPTPLVLALHGLGDTASNFVAAAGLIQQANMSRYLLAYPDGQATPFSGSPQGWNASCCGLFAGAGMQDDVTYLRAVLADAASQYNVDPDRVFVLGYSNGGFMANALACVAADRIAAIVPMAGTLFTFDQPSCVPEQPVAVMHVHGTADGTVPFNGGTYQLGLATVAYLGAEAVADHWVGENSCPNTPSTSTADAEASIAGSETDIEAWGPCEQGTDVELWTVNGGQHLMNFTPAVFAAINDFFVSHPRTNPAPGPSTPAFCACDTTTACTESCACDPECDDGGCAATPGEASTAALVLVTLLVARRRRRA